MLAGGLFSEHAVPLLCCTFQYNRFLLEFFRQPFIQFLHPFASFLI